MKLSHRLRSLAALLTLMGVLFSQLALATYVCPGSQAMALAALERETSGEMPCHGDVAPQPQSALCAAHCQQGDQSLDKPATPAVPALTLVAILPGPCVPDVASAASPPGEQRSLLARATAPPVAVRHCCLRI